MAKRSKNPKASASGRSNGLPSFDEKALSALSAKIEEDIAKGKAHRQDQGLNRGQKQNLPKKGHGRTESDAKKTTSELNRGIKRDVHGNEKPAENGNRRSQSVYGKRMNGTGNDGESILLREILALGGTEEDLDLVADAVTDDDEGLSIDSIPDKLFQKDLADFVSRLGIDPEIREDHDEIGRNEDIGDEWEEASELDLSDVPTLKAYTESVGGVLATESQDEPSANTPNRLLFEARPDWHAAPLSVLPTPEGSDLSQYHDAIVHLKNYATSLLHLDGKLYASKHLSSSSSHRFLSTIMSSGTLSDKVSALTLVVQESPVHTIKSFESLLTLARKRSRGQAVTALGALKDLLGAGVILPADRRLRAFVSQPGLLGTLQKLSITNWTSEEKLPGKISKAHLISWAYEDWLKESYFDMLKVLEGWCNDEVEYARSRAVTYVYELLKEKPEQEANLLRLLVNKLGDPDKKIASRTSYLLLQLQTSHPLMKPIIVRSIEDELLLRPGQSSHAKYYAINTLNQTILSSREEDLAKRLLTIYFDLFVSLLMKPDQHETSTGPIVNRKGQIQGGGGPMGKKAKSKVIREEEANMAKEETTEKMISSVLTGVNRAFPFSKTDDLSLEKHMDTLFRITHSANFNTSVQALMLIEQLATSKHIAVDRFYRTLYESLLDPRLVTSSKHALYLNLLYRAIRSDLNIKRVKAFVKRMLQVATLHQPPFICGIFYLLRELEATFPGLPSLIHEPEETDEDAEEAFHDVPEDGHPPITSKPAVDPRSAGHNLYDGRKRDPEHSNADNSCLWESIPFLAHFHPSVSLFATRLLSHEKMPPKPDLASHTLSNFLDKFVYRNAKAAAGATRGSSIMQPLSGGDNRGILLSNHATNKQHEPINTEAFWRKKAEDVAVDEVFFHKYFNRARKLTQSSREKRELSKAPENSTNMNGEDEEEIWQALVDSRPEVEGGNDEDSDMDMLHLDASDAELSASASEIVADDKTSASEGSDTEGLDELDEEFPYGNRSDTMSVDELFAKELKTIQADDSDKEKETRREKRRKLKNLPTFASAEDYAEMLDNDEGEDL